MPKRYLLLLLLLGVWLIQLPLLADSITVFDDKGTFLAATGAANATGGPLPDIGSIASGSQTVGDVTITTDSGGLFIGTANLGPPDSSGNCSGVIGCDWTLRHPGADIAISGDENFHVDITSGGPVFSLGFDFVKPISDPSYVASPGPSTFTVTLTNGGSFVNSFTFDTPTAAFPADALDFVGVWSSAAFDHAGIVETVGGIDDEYWGEFYTGKTANPVPEPATLILLGSVLLLLTAGKRRRITG